MKAFVNHTLYVMKDNAVTFVAFIMFLIIIFLAFFGPVLAPYDPLETNVMRALAPPSLDHWFGTDNLGRDIFSRVLVATRLDMIISVSAVALSLCIGVMLGSMAGYLGGWIDRVTSRLVDTIMAFPIFVLAMGIVSALGNTVENIIYATAIINLPFYIRFSRAEINVRMHSEYVDAAKVSGCGNARIMGVHLLPNILPPMMVQVSLNMGWASLNAAGLSFIGLGVRPPAPEWGIMVAEGAQYVISGEWWVVVFPGLALMLAVFCFNLLGDGLRDIIDPKRRT